MFGRKKNKLDTSFIKQKIEKLIIDEHLTVFNLLKDKDEVMDEDNVIKEKANIEKMRIGTSKAFNNQYERCSAVATKVEFLRYKQRLRRQKILDWVENYCFNFEQKEEKFFILKSSKGCNQQLLKAVLVEAEIFDLSEFEEPAEEEVEEAEEDVSEENVEDSEEVFEEVSLVEEDNEIEKEEQEQKDEKNDIENIVNS